MMRRVPIVVKRSYSRSGYLLGFLLLLIGGCECTLLVVMTPVHVGGNCDAFCMFQIKFIGTANGNLALLLVLMTLFYFSGWQIAAKRDGKRQAIARGDATSSHIASLQPQADAEALILPCTFHISMPWRPFWLSLGTVLIVVSCLLSIIAPFAIPKTDLPTLLLVTIFVIGYMDVSFILLFLCVAILLRQKVVITEGDITIYQGGRKHTVRWDEARSFLLPQSSQTLPESLRKFELASRDGLVTWSYFPTTESGFFPYALLSCPKTITTSSMR